VKEARGSAYAGSQYLTLGERAKFWLVGVLGSLFVRGLILTLRVRVIGERFPPRPPGTGSVYCFWHSQLLALAYLYRNRNVHVLVSGHRDGEYIVQVTRRLGYGAVRGSSTRGGIRVLTEALARLGEGIDIAVTPDGPRGPRQKFKPGALFLARESGAPIVLGACVPEKAWRFNSWDGFYVPKPFSRAALVVGDPIHVPKTLTDDEVEAKCLELENTLNELTQRAEHAFEEA
jgi:lysophospholipid acyltransferase (LPLAT)-like uncharacterized protein